ncbi:hypothetical protein LIER_26260 [Lithospermum erythrorhizon]|uniref:Pectin acetylesterase n=1 Tax=Lithospermum erythrorhizon TaxID=34254 RepID=A0AAV3RB43_LITER
MRSRVHGVVSLQGVQRILPRSCTSRLDRISGGGWCNDVKSCLKRKVKEFGSSRRMRKQHNFTGILRNKAQENPGSRRISYVLYPSISSTPFKFYHIT